MSRFSFHSIFILLISFVFISLSTVKSYAEGNVVVTPRVWYAMFHEKFFGNWSTQDPISMPLYGGTVTYNNPALFNDFSISTTLLFGEGDTTDDMVGVQGGGLVYWKEKRELERFDAEVLVHKQIGGGETNFHFGARYIHLDYNPGYRNLDLTKAKDDFYLAEIGFGLVGNITEDGKHRLFGNFTFMAGLRDTEVVLGSSNGGAILKQTKDGFVYGVDLNLGYAFALSENVNLDARYRVFILTDDDSNDNFKSSIIHGPQISASVKLN